LNVPFSGSKPSVGKVVLRKIPVAYIKDQPLKVHRQKHPLEQLAGNYRRTSNHTHSAPDEKKVDKPGLQE